MLGLRNIELCKVQLQINVNISLYNPTNQIIYARETKNSVQSNFDFDAAISTKN
jgi:hypothetical protein